MNTFLHTVLRFCGVLSLVLGIMFAIRTSLGIWWIVTAQLHPLDAAKLPSHFWIHVLFVGAVTLGNTLAGISLFKQRRRAIYWAVPFSWATQWVAALDEFDYLLIVGFVPLLGGIVAWFLAVFPLICGGVAIACVVQRLLRS